MIPNMKKRYIRKGQCDRCGACCIVEDPSCPHLEMNNGKATCKILNKQERPLRCLLFPELPPIPFDSCGYYFIDTWENNKIVKRIV